LTLDQNGLLKLLKLKYEQEIIQLITSELNYTESFGMKNIEDVVMVIQLVDIQLLDHIISF
jgi:hypothetical protein